MSPTDTGDPPVLRVLRGHPDHAELAALVVVLAARTAHVGTSAVTRRNAGWNQPAVLLRRPLPSAANGWRASALRRALTP